MIDKITQASLLFDFYGQLLTERKQEVMQLYHEENMSLSEIAEEFGISRAAVYDSLKNAERLLQEYENKLGLISKLVKSSQVINKLGSKLDDMIVEYENNDRLVGDLREMKSIISKLEEV